MDLLHLFLLRLEDVDNLCLLIGAQIEALGQHLGATIGVKSCTAPAVLGRSARRRCLLIAARRILRDDRRRGIRQSSKCQSQYPILQHEISFYMPKYQGHW